MMIPIVPVLPSMRSVWPLIPVGLAFGMATYYAYAILYDGHGITIGIGGYGREFGVVAYKSTTIIEKHVLLLTLPSDFSYSAPTAPDLCVGLFDILHRIHSIQDVKIPMGCPVCTHADAQVVSATIHKIRHQIAHAPGKETIVAVRIPYAAGKGHDVGVGQQISSELALIKGLDIVVWAESVDHALATFTRAFGVMLEQGYAGLHHRYLAQKKPAEAGL